MSKNLTLKSRLRNVLIYDKNGVSGNLCALIQQDVENILKSYMNIADNGVHVNYNICENGEYVININCKAKRIKDVGFYPSNFH